jgi:transglutaminase-like putative cysteine protease
MWRPRILTRKTGAASSEAPSLTLFFWLVGAFLLTLLPHVDQLPGWLTFSILVAMGLRCVGEWKRWPLPTTTSTGVVAVCLLAGVYLQYRTVLGHEAGTPFMAGLLAIKFYELRGPRDITLIIFSSFFVVMSALLFSQAIELFIYCLIMMWLLTGILLRTYMGDKSDHRLLRVLGQCSFIFVQALPLALLLFFFFPRYAGRFQLSFNDAVTGLSDHVEPGSIADLASNDAPAMRVRFPGGTFPLNSGAMYWRAIVLWNFDGRAWTRGGPVTKGVTILADLPKTFPPPVLDGESIQQQIIIWPQTQPWIPALDHPISPAFDLETSRTWSTTLNGDVLITQNGQPIDYKRQYSVTSRWITRPEVLTPGQEALQKREEQVEGIQLPDKIDPRVRALADQLYAPNHDTAAYVQAVEHYFRAQHFQLTTEPGVLGRDPVAGFLFRTKKGFCEHYASAFGVLMRLEKIPCRMVVGYRGGDFDPYGPFYMISQSNAHAWNEVWFDKEKRWVREDATLVISGGTSFALAANAGLAADDDLSLSLGNHRFTFLSGNSLPLWMRHGLRDVQMRREEMEAQWDDWVFSYDPNTQGKLAEALGLGRQAWIVLLAGCVVVAGLGATAVALWLARKKKLSPTERFYARFCRRMAQRGAPRDPWEGPRAYSERLVEKFPDQKEPIDEAGWIVAEYRYGGGSQRSPEELRKLLEAASETS